MSANRTTKSDKQRSGTIAAYASERNGRGASVNTSPQLRLLVNGLLFAGVFVAELYFVEWLARVVAAVGWFVPVFCVGGFVVSILAIVYDLRRAWRKQEARRARLAEACGLRREDLL